MIELLICAGITGVVLTLEHIALSRHPWMLYPPVTYGVGVATLATGFTAWCVWLDILIIAVAFWVLACLAGLPIVVAYWIRGRLAQLDDVAFDAGQLQQRRPIQPFRPYTQDIIDGGGYGGNASSPPHRSV